MAARRTQNLQLLQRDLIDINQRISRRGFTFKQMIEAYLVHGTSSISRSGHPGHYVHSVAEIVSQDNILPSLEKDSSFLPLTSGWINVKSLRNELEKSIQSVPILGTFSHSTELEDFRIEDSYEQIKTQCPALFSMWLSLTKPLRDDSDRDDKQDMGKFIQWCALLTGTMAPRKSNSLRKTAGLYFHSMGVKRRVLSVLAGLGITDSYQATQRAREEVADQAKVLGSETA
jgi:hypothetical protein